MNNITENAYETGYRIPKELIQLLIEKFGYHGQCCDFCDRSHVFNDKCGICGKQKIRCGSLCKNKGYQVCIVCKKHINNKPCRVCKINGIVPKNLEGRQAIRKIRGKLIDGWMCSKCISIKPCKYCENMVECPPWCKTQK